MTVFLSQQFDGQAIRGARDRWQDDVWVVLRYIGEYYRTNTNLEAIIVSPELRDAFVDAYVDCYMTTLYMFPYLSKIQFYEWRDGKKEWFPNPIAWFERKCWDPNE